MKGPLLRPSVRASTFTRWRYLTLAWVLLFDTGFPACKLTCEERSKTDWRAFYLGTAASIINRTATIGVGERVTLAADLCGRPHAVTQPSWRVTAPDIAMVLPSVGAVVALQGISPGTTQVFAVTPAGDIPLQEVDEIRVVQAR